MSLIILLKLLIAHLIGDFIIQQDSWVQNRRDKRLKSPYLYIHVLITSVLSYLFVAQWQWWWLIPVIFISHLLIDIWKVTLRHNGLKSFIIDQLLHVVSLVALWLIITNSWAEVSKIFIQFTSLTYTWVLLIAYIIILWPCGIFIREFTNKWRIQIELSNDENSSLANAGKWIGYLERILILTFVLLNQYASIGLLIAAKSILRLNPKDENRSKAVTEYILVGTLLSFTITILIGLAVKFI